jgi:HD-like signal output (HDOD) protein
MHPKIEAIRDEILEAIESDELMLPTMPEVAIRLREEANNDNADAKSIAKIIGNDAALTARIIRVANSPLVRGLQVVEDLQMAISRMGINYASNLAIGIAMEQLFQATSEAVDDRLRETWEHSTEVASLSHVLCRHFTKLSPDQATLGGLIHEIGKLPILTWADDHDWDEALIDKVCEELHPDLGRLILKAWEFPAELIDVPVQCHQFSRVASKVDYVDIVMVANLHSYSGSEHPYAKMDWSKIHAFENMGIAIDLIEEDDSELLEEISAAKAALI